MRYAIYGIGGFGREIAPIAREYLRIFGSASRSPEDDVVFVDDAEDCPQVCNGMPVIDFGALCSELHRDRHIVVAIGNGRTREHVERKCIDAGLTIGTLRSVHSRALDAIVVGPGAVLCDHVTLTANVTIGRSFQANIYSYVAHDCVIGDYVTLAPRVNCNGNVRIGDHAYVGTGASIIQGTPDEPLLIGTGAVVGMGAVVTKSVPPRTVVAGNPARVVRSLE